MQSQYKENVDILLRMMPETPPKMWSLEDFQKFLDEIELTQLKDVFSSLRFNINKNLTEFFVKRKGKC